MLSFKSKVKKNHDILMIV